MAGIEDSKINTNLHKSRTNIIGIDAIYVLSVRSFTQRIAHIESLMSGLSLSFEFIFDHDASELTNKELAMFGECGMGAEHKSLVLKNISAWERMLECNHRRVLIFEDDVLLQDDFCESLSELMPDIMSLRDGFLVFLGGADTYLDKEFVVAGGSLVSKEIATAEAYITDAAAISKRIEWVHSNKIVLPADHLIKAIDKELEISHFWPRKPMAAQGSIVGNFVTTLDGSRSKHGYLYLKTKFLLNVFRRRVLRQWVYNILGIFER